MSEKLFNSFIKESDVSQELYNKYEATLPSGLLDLWKKYGFGSFMDGYLKIINPEEYKSLIIDTYFRGNIAIPIFVTAFADVIAWEENRYLRMIKYKNGFFQGMAAGFGFFLEDLENGRFNEKFFDIDMYTEATRMWGNIEFDECFGFVPLLGLGGSQKVENLKKLR